ncbi:MAG TPA: protein kinase [Blastocatellia bacterium]|nr:protein kinase [Blastocatellia bacterium]
MTPDIRQDTGQDIRQTVEDLFQTVCELPPTDRAAYLDQACSGDEALRREIEELLKYHESHETFLEKPALQDAARRMAARLKVSEIQDSTLSEGDWMIGPYRILDQLGKGGMGVVYLAEDARGGKRVAIKVLPKDFVLDEDRLARFNREGRMLEELKSLKHPNIAEIYEQAEYDGAPCLVLEYVPGDTLSERLRKGPLPIPVALQIGLQIAGALESAHRQRIVHRDLKPANIKITPDGQVKILDFGLAKRFQTDLANEESDYLQTRSFSLTESGMLIGTPAYMSPEQWNGQQTDQRTDLWSFGCVLYEMLTGKAPFAGKTRAETMKTVLDANPSWQQLPPGTPLVIQGLLLRCFQPEANQRLQSAQDARKVITEAITDNKFAPLLYLKTWIGKLDGRVRIWFGKFSRKEKAALFTTSLILLTALLLLALKGAFVQPEKRIFLSDKKDLAAILEDAIKGMTPEMVRAALMPDKQSSDELLQSEQWKKLMDKPDNKQAIEDVINDMNSLIEKEGGSAKLYAILAQAYLFKFYLTKKPIDKDNALKAVRVAKGFGVETLDVIIAEGNALITVGEFNEAIEVLEKARSQHPDEPEILLGLAMAHDFSGDEKGQAEGLYNAVIDARQRREGKPYWGDLNDFGWYYFERGRYEQAADRWREVVKLNHLSPTGYINLGNALLHLGCFNAAVKQYLDSIPIGGEAVEAHINLGAAYFYLGNYADSISHLRLITDGAQAREDAILIEAWLNLGDSLSQIGQQNEAKDAYSIGLRLVDRSLMQLHSNIEVMALRAEFIAKLNSLGQGTGQDDPVNLIEKTLDSRFDCLECIVSAVTIYHIMGKDDAALQMAERAVEEGFSPFLLVNNPELSTLRTRPEFKRIQQIARTVRGKCEDK